MLFKITVFIGAKGGYYTYLRRLLKILTISATTPVSIVTKRNNPSYVTIVITSSFEEQPPTWRTLCWIIAYFVENVKFCTWHFSFFGILLIKTNERSVCMKNWQQRSPVCGAALSRGKLLCHLRIYRAAPDKRHSQTGLHGKGFFNFRRDWHIPAWKCPVGGIQLANLRRCGKRLCKLRFGIRPYGVYPRSQHLRFNQNKIVKKVA